ncbi:MAG: hypothetical protein IKS93_02525 [Methanobrevibacter sp.]|nr:hypothetical protein [Methanobrevibacter sp.]
MTDEKGSFYLIESILAITILLMAIFVVNTVISMSSPDYSYDTLDFKTSQDIMEILSGKVNFTDKSFIGSISDILKDNKNSKKSVKKVSDICKEKFDTFNLKNYRFCENNVLDGKVLASSGDFSKASSVSQATRTYGDYSYTLYTW